MLGGHSYLELGLTFTRLTSYYLLHTYLPSAAMVVAPWGIVLLGRESRIIRNLVALGALLGLNSLTAEVEAAVPHVDYLKASDIWLGVCYGFLVITLVAFNVSVRSRPSVDRGETVLSENDVEVCCKVCYVLVNTFTNNTSIKNNKTNVIK